MLGQLNGLQVVKKERHLPLFTAVSFNLLAGFPRPVSFRSGVHNETKRDCIRRKVMKQQNFIN